MDIGEITKVANRKRLNSDAEKLREKVSRETAKIIKLKVAQDTAYWDLKEKLQQVEGNHERLQQNMVEVQMEHEAISGQYQDELRLRPDTLNKLVSSREICDVLEEYSERLKETVSRCKSDQASLYDVYQKSGQLVRDLKHRHERMDEKNRQLINCLEEKVKVTSAQQNQLVEYLRTAKQQVDTELSETRLQLVAAQSQKNELVGTAHELKQALELNKHDLQTKESTILNIQTEVKQLINEFNNQSNELKAAIMKKDKEIKDSAEAIEALKRAVTNQEAFTASVHKQNSELLEKLAVANEQLQGAKDEHQKLLATIENTNAENKIIKNVVDSLQDIKASLEKTIENKNEIIENADKEIEKVKEDLNEKAQENVAKSLQLGELQSHLEAATGQITELQASYRQLETSKEEIETAFNLHKDEHEAKLKEMIETIADKEKELDTKAGTIAQLMCEVGSAADAAARLDAALVKLRKEVEVEREIVNKKDAQQVKQIEHLQTVVADKESELSKQMTIILDMRGEKERLQEKIQGMQSKIDNIQKELSAPQPKVQIGDAPEQDDNALAFALTPRPRPPPPRVLKQTMDKPREAPQKAQQDDMLFNIFSDSSMDDMIDPKEVNRRFEALSRGEQIPVGPLNVLKRRPPPDSVNPDKVKDLLSLSQVKTNLKNKENRTFFKNKRDNKLKKVK